MAKKIDQCTKKYAVTKAVSFAAIPVGATAENLKKAHIVETDSNVKDTFDQLREHLDDYHRDYMESRLKDLPLKDLEEYAALYNAKDKTDKDKKRLDDLEFYLQADINKALTDTEQFKKMFKKELVEELLPAYLKGEDLLLLEPFKGRFGYFNSYNTSRMAFYKTNDNNSPYGIVARRLIEDNLPLFLDDLNIYAIVKEHLQEETLAEVEKISDPYTLNEVFSLSFFSSNSLNQQGIDFINTLIGGYSTADGNKIQGLNESISLYNQHQADKENRLPLFVNLKKLPLAKTSTASFTIPKFDKTADMVAGITHAFEDPDGVLETLAKCSALFERLSSFDTHGIYYKAQKVTNLSLNALGKWNALTDAWNARYESEFPVPEKESKQAKYFDTRDKARQKVQSYSLADIQSLTSYVEDEKARSVDTTKFIALQILAAIEKAADTYPVAKEVLTGIDGELIDIRNKEREEKVAIIKDAMDAVKTVENYLSPLKGTGKEEYKDLLFYSEFINLFSALKFSFDRTYDMTRNFVTKKPYSLDKMALSFNYNTFMGGWDKDKLKDYGSTLLRKDGKYYLAVVNHAAKDVFATLKEDPSGSNFEKIEYKQIPQPYKMLPKCAFAKSNTTFPASGEILRIARTDKSFSTSSDKFNLDDLHTLIDYYKGFIAQYPAWNIYTFRFKDTKDYNKIDEFYEDVSNGAYDISFRPVSERDVNKAVDNGDIFLFQIYNKDFSEHSYGKKNLHTLLFEAAFSEENLKNAVIRLNAGSKLFFRPASMNPRTIHEANKPIANKNELSDNKKAVYPYDITKDCRFTKDTYLLTLIFTINNAGENVKTINPCVNELIRNDKNTHIIGIDRGEKNLLYVTVIDGNGNIVEQKSLNTIVAENKNGSRETNYQKKLSQKEMERKAARESWQTVENIKELKQGYLSQVVHEIVKLVEKYDAVVALENLSPQFKSSRASIEKQVYQNFEKALIAKLNLLHIKTAKPTEPGGILNGYQLADPFVSFEEMYRNSQNGFIFYVPSYYTARLDPTTGYIPFLNTKYKNMAQAETLITKQFKAIRFNQKAGYFEFVAEDKFGDTWTICSNADRVRMTKDKTTQRWKAEDVILTEAFMKLFDEFGVEKSDDMLKDIVEVKKADFYKRFFDLLHLTEQVVNCQSEDKNDFFISPVRNEQGFFDSRNAEENNINRLPRCANSVGAYNTAKKALWIVKQIQETEPGEKIRYMMKNAEWVEFARSETIL